MLPIHAWKCYVILPVKNETWVQVHCYTRALNYWYMVRNKAYFILQMTLHSLYIILQKNQLSCNNSPSPASLAFICHYLPSTAITCLHLSSPAITCHHLPSLALTYHHLPSPVITCPHLPSHDPTSHHMTTHPLA